MAATHRRVRLAPTLTALTFVFGLGPACRTSTSNDTTTAVLPTTSLAIAGAGNRGVSLAARGAEVVAVWAATTGETTDIYASTSADGGRTFSAPVRVNDTTGDARVTGEQPPRVSIGSHIDVVWESKRDGAAAVRLSSSTDGGRTFAPASTVNRADANNPRGWASVTSGANGQPYVAWLDARSDAPATGHGEHGHGAHGEMQQSVFFAASPETGARIAQGTCFCCKTSVTTAADGAIYVAWRHVYPVNLRDIAVARSTDGGRTFGDAVRVSEDHWQIDACPEDGPSIATGAAGVVHIVWPTFLAETGHKAIFYSVSTDGGRTFAPRIRVDTTEDATAAHPQIAVDGTRATVVWDETTGKTSRVRSRAFGVSADGPSWSPESTALYVSRDAVVAEYPSVAFSDGQAVVAWTETAAGGTTRIVVRRQ